MKNKKEIIWEAKYSTLHLIWSGKGYSQKDREEFQAELEDRYFKNRGCKVYILATRAMSSEEETNELIEKEDEKIKRKIFAVLDRTRKRIMIKLWFGNLVIKIKFELLRLGAWLFLGRRL